MSEARDVKVVLFVDSDWASALDSVRADKFPDDTRSSLCRRILREWMAHQTGEDAVHGAPTNAVLPLGSVWHRRA